MNSILNVDIVLQDPASNEAQSSYLKRIDVRGKILKSGYSKNDLCRVIAVVDHAADFTLVFTHRKKALPLPKTYYCR